MIEHYPRPLLLLAARDYHKSNPGIILSIYFLGRIYYDTICFLVIREKFNLDDAWGYIGVDLDKSDMLGIRGRIDLFPDKVFPSVLLSRGVIFVGNRASQIPESKHELNRMERRDETHPRS